MEATVITMVFDSKRRDFPREELEDFLLNKEVHDIQGQFFHHEKVPYWSVFVRFERIVAKEDGVKDLSPEERKAFDELRKWRKDKSLEAGFPAYIIATNSQLVRMVRKRVRSYAGFDGIKGFGKKRREKYGADIVRIMNLFFDE